MDTYTVAQYVADLRRITANAESEAQVLEQVAPLAQKLAKDGSWIEDRFYHPDKDVGSSGFMLHEEDNHELAVLAFSWYPGMGVPPHDHGTWAIVVVVDGVERNVYYERTDDGSKEGYANIRVSEEIKAGPLDVVCIPSGGIHSIHNDNDAVTLSLHTYGKHFNHTGRSQFDPETGVKKPYKVPMN